MKLSHAKIKQGRRTEFARAPDLPKQIPNSSWWIRTVTTYKFPGGRRYSEHTEIAPHGFFGGMPDGGWFEGTADDAPKENDQ